MITNAQPPAQLDSHPVRTEGGPSDRAAAARAEQKARHFWITLIVGLLSLQVAVGITAVVLAVGDPSAAVIPNYHQAAVNWDTTRRALQLTEKLDWSIEINVGRTQPSLDQRELRVKVLEPSGQPRRELNVRAKLYHHARGAKLYRLRLEEIAPGEYVGLTNLTQAGLWQIELQIEGLHGLAAVSQEFWVE